MLSHLERPSGHSLDEGRGDDDAGAEVACEEVDIDIDTHPADAGGHDGEEGGSTGHDEDHEEGRDAGAQAAVILVLAGLEETHDLGRVGGVEVYRGWIEI